MNNIILIGMPGAGKSTVGVVLAKALGYSFLDSDLLIQEKENMVLHEIIETYGLDAFNQIENKVNSSIETTKTVIATGGSAIYGKEAMEHFKSIGTIIYLNLSFDELTNRLGDLNQRGVSIRQGQTLAELYDERKSLYEKYADITVNCDNQSIRDLVENMIKYLE